MPQALSIVSVDAYDRNVMNVNQTKSVYNQYVFPALAAHQSVWLIPGALDRNDTASAARAHAYWEWALTEPRVSGLMFFAWSFLEGGKMSKTAAVWLAMGECVKSGLPPEQCQLPLRDPRGLSTDHRLSLKIDDSAVVMTRSRGGCHLKSDDETPDLVIDTSNLGRVVQQRAAGVLDGMGCYPGDSPHSDSVPDALLAPLYFHGYRGCGTGEAEVACPPGTGGCSGNIATPDFYPRLHALGFGEVQMLLMELWPDTLWNAGIFPGQPEGNWTLWDSLVRQAVAANAGRPEVTFEIW